MKDYYTISEFYLMLKLGFFKSGKVEDRGYFTSGEMNNIFLTKSLDQYQRQLYAKKQLAIGLYLLDFFLLKKESNFATYIFVISVCNTTLNNKEKIYVLKLSKASVDTDINTFIDTLFSKQPIKKRKRRSLFRGKSRLGYDSILLYKYKR